MKFVNCFEGLEKHFNDHLWYYLISILFIATGIILGLYCVKYMGSSDKETLINYIKGFGMSGAIDGMSRGTIFLGTLKNNLPIIIGFWILAVTVLGMPVILIIDAYKGFTLGFTFSFFIYGLKGRGLLLSLIGVLPQNIIYIPCLVFLSVFSMEYSIGMFKEKFNIGKKFQDTLSLKEYSFYFIIVTAVMGIGFLIETFITPGLIKMVLAGV